MLETQTTGAVGMKTVLKTRWRKFGHFRVQTIVREAGSSAIRQAWFRRIFISSSRQDSPDSPPTDS